MLQMDTQDVTTQEFVVADEQDTCIEADGVDWCAWWAEYAETLE